MTIKNKSFISRVKRSLHVYNSDFKELDETNLTLKILFQLTYTHYYI